MKDYQCLRCKHKWYPRTPDKPKVCPKCKSPYWDKPYTRVDLIKKEEITDLVTEMRTLK